MRIVIHGALATWLLVVFNVASLEFVKIVVVRGGSETRRRLNPPKSLGRLKSRQDQSVAAGLALVRSSCTSNLSQFIFIQVGAPRKLLVRVQRLV